MTEIAHAPITPGEILSEEFLKPLGISQYRLAQATGLTPTHIGQIVRGKRRITPDAGLRISRALGVNAYYWIDLQMNYDTTMARLELDRSAILDSVPVLVAV
ncbi:MAG: HigA family addiction module antidote protein [Cellulomonadaceae bacterium]|jgi:addiction module HigA family antidote|nr:HigA family addiction module antidote protein [Cellulomonadaceae bacterium]